jgi:hypothetical protein
VGEKWTWRDERGIENTQEVVGFEGDLVQVKWANPSSAPDKEGILFFDSDRVIRKAIRPNGEIVTQQGAGIYTTVGQKLMDFPLQVGKKWDRSYMTQPLSGLGTLRTYLNRYKVLACEEVATAAGKFSALKVELEQSVIGGRGSGTVYNWYSPQAKNYIRGQYVPSRDWWGVGRVFDNELIKLETK